MAQPKVTITLDGYPAHATDISSLPLVLQNKLQAFSVGVTGALIFPAFLSNSIHILIEGHADHDIQGDDFENKISLNRAITCKNIIERNIDTQASLMWLDSKLLNRLSYSIFSWGATKPIFNNPRNEEERKANRRVDVTNILGDAIPLDNNNDSVHRALQLIQNDPQNGPIRRVKCFLEKMITLPDYIDGYPNYAAAHRLPGTGGWPNWPQDQWHMAIKSFMVHVTPQVISVMNLPDTAQQKAGLLAIDDDIGRNINDWSAQLNAGAATGLFDQSVLAFIKGLMANNRAILSCYAGYSRLRHND